MELAGVEVDRDGAGSELQGRLRRRAGDRREVGVVAGAQHGAQHGRVEGAIGGVPAVDGASDEPCGVRRDDDVDAGNDGSVDIYYESQ